MFADEKCLLAAQTFFFLFTVRRRSVFRGMSGRASFVYDGRDKSILSRSKFAKSLEIGAVWEAVMPQKCKYFDTPIKVGKPIPPPCSEERGGLQASSSPRCPLEYRSMEILLNFSSDQVDRERGDDNVERIPGETEQRENIYIHEPPCRRSGAWNDIIFSLFIFSLFNIIFFSCLYSRCLVHTR